MKGLFPGALLFLCLLAGRAAEAAPEPVSVAVVPFLSGGGRATPLERTATALLREHLETDPTVRVVPADRTSTVAGDLGYAAANPMGDDAARHLGTLADADIVIIGRTEAAGTELVLSARLVGVRSLASEEVTAKGSRVGQIKPLVLSFSEQVAGSLASSKGVLSSQRPEDRILAEVRGRFDGLDLPAVYLSVTEEYGGDRRASSETEELLAAILTGTGFRISPDITGSDIILFARARGRARGRVRSAVISSADLELRAVMRIGGRLLYQESISHSAVDSLAATAGTRAFREGILLAADSLLPSLADAAESPAGNH